MDIDVANAVYTIWTGTNDLGPDALIPDSQLLGMTIVDCVQSVFDQIRSLYNHEGRRFVLLKVVPLNLAPQYALPGKGGLSETQYWHDKPIYLMAVSLAMSLAMQKQVMSVNTIFR